MAAHQEPVETKIATGLYGVCEEVGSNKPMNTIGGATGMITGGTGRFGNTVLKHFTERILQGKEKTGCE